MIIQGIEISDHTLDYLQACLLAERDESDEYGGHPLDENFGLCDFAAAAIDLANADCEAFYAKAERLFSDGDPKTWGHDFWLTRNGHGCGFWAGDYTNGDELTEIANSFCERYVYVGDDGRLYFQ